MDEPRRLPLPPIAEVLDSHREALIAVPGVVGTAIGICEGVPCIRVFVIHAAAAAKLPTSIGGYRVRVDVTGRFDAR